MVNFEIKCPICGQNTIVKIPKPHAFKPVVHQYECGTCNTLLLAGIKAGVGRKLNVQLSIMKMSETGKALIQERKEQREKIAREAAEEAAQETAGSGA